MMSPKEYVTFRKEQLVNAASDFICVHRSIYGLEGCEDPILIAAEKLLEELKRERN